MFITTSGSVTGDAVIKVDMFSDQQRQTVGELGKSWVATLAIYPNAVTLIPLIQLFLDADALNRLVLEGQHTQRDLDDHRQGVLSEQEQEAALAAFDDEGPRFDTNPEGEMAP